MPIKIGPGEGKYHRIYDIRKIFIYSLVENKCIESPFTVDDDWENNSTV